MPPSIAECHDLSTGNELASVPHPVAKWQPMGMVTFGERLTWAMDQRHWRQSALAEKSGITPGAVSRHLKQTRPPSSESVKKYVNALGVSTDWLAYGRGEAYSVAASTPAESSRGPLLGLAALEAVLETFSWPPGTDMDTIDSVCEDARVEAATPRGSVRPVSAWRVYLERRLTTQPISRMGTSTRAARGT